MKRFVLILLSVLFTGCDDRTTEQKFQDDVKDVARMRNEREKHEAKQKAIDDYVEGQIRKEQGRGRP